MKTEDQVKEAQAETQSKEKPMSMGERIDKGFEEIELLTAQEAEAKAKPKEKGDGKPADKTKEEDSTSQKPFKILKVQGKDFPVMTEAEFEALASKGADYTKKTQALADERRAAEAEVKGQADKLATALDQMNNFADQLIKGGYLPKNVGEAKKAAAVAAGDDAELADKVDEEDMPVFKEFQMDPAQALPHEKKIVKTLVELRKIVDEMRHERANEILEQAIAEERENFPFEDIKDDQGQNLTQKNIVAIVLMKKQMSSIERPDMDQIIAWSREAVHELHEKEKAAKNVSSVPNAEIDALKAELSALKAEKEARVEKDKLPPSIKPIAKDVDGKKSVVAKREGKSLDDYMNEGFADPDIIKALTGG